MNKRIITIFIVLAIAFTQQLVPEYHVIVTEQQLIDLGLIPAPIVNTVVIQSDLNEYITSINPNPLTTQNTYPYNVNIPIAPNAVWVWASNWNKPRCPPNITIT